MPPVLVPPQYSAPKTNPAKKIILSLLLLAVVAAGIYALVIYKPWGGQELSANEKIQQEQALVADIIKTNDPAQCEKAKNIVINGSSYKVVCENNIYMTLAEDKLDISYCDKLDDKSASINDCKTKVLTIKAITTTNPSVCDAGGTVELKNECLYNYWSSIALKNSDPMSCKNVPILQSVSACKDNVYIKMLVESKQVSCTSFSTGLVADCNRLSNIKAKKSASITDCLSISDPRIQDFCNTRIK